MCFRQASGIEHQDASEEGAEDGDNASDFMPNSVGGQSSPSRSAISRIAIYQLEGNHPRTTALLTAVMPTPKPSAMVLRPMASASVDAFIMTSHNPHLVEKINPTNRGLSREQYSDDLHAMGNHVEFGEIGARLEAIREAFSDLSQKDWANRHGFSPTRWNNWEKGVRRIPVDEAETLADLYGLDLDFIYRGRRSGLSENASKVL